MLNSLSHAAQCGLCDWMPSHITVKTMDKGLVKSGKPISIVDVLANGLADALAKEQAYKVRTPAKVRNDIKAEHDTVTKAARTLGYVTAAADVFSCSTCCPDFPSRDSKPLACLATPVENEPRRSELAKVSAMMP